MDQIQEAACLSSIEESISAQLTLLECLNRVVGGKPAKPLEYTVGLFVLPKRVDRRTRTSIDKI